MLDKGKETVIGPPLITSAGRAPSFNSPTIYSPLTLRQMRIIKKKMQKLF